MVSFLILAVSDRVEGPRLSAQVTRDEKPGHLVLGDFGSACRFHAGDRFKAFVGSPFYASPECLQGDYDERADVWSCGVVILSLVSGDLTDRQYYSLHERGVRAAVADKACSQDLLDLLAMLLDKDVEARTSAAGALNESRSAWKSNFGRPTPSTRQHHAL